MQAFLRAGIHTFATPDTLRGVRNFLQRKGRRTGRFAGVTGNAQFLVPVNLHKAKAVKPTVNCSKRAQVLTKGTVNLHGEQDNNEQNPQLPKKQAAGLAPQGFVCVEQGKRSEQGAGWAQIFAEGRDLCQSSEQKCGTDADQKNQHRVFGVL